jgi:hypothetical protein
MCISAAKMRFLYERQDTYAFGIQRCKWYPKMTVQKGIVKGEKGAILRCDDEHHEPVKFITGT